MQVSTSLFKMDNIFGRPILILSVWKKVIQT